MRKQLYLNDNIASRLKYYSELMDLSQSKIVSKALSHYFEHLDSYGTTVTEKVTQALKERK